MVLRQDTAERPGKDARHGKCGHARYHGGKPAIERAAGKTCRQFLHRKADACEQKEEQREPDRERHTSDAEQRQQPVEHPRIRQSIAIGIQIEVRIAEIGDSDQLHYCEDQHDDERGRKRHVMRL